MKKLEFVDVIRMEIYCFVLAGWSDILILGSGSPTLESSRPVTYTKQAISPVTPSHTKALSQEFDLDGSPHHQERKPRRKYSYSPPIQVVFHFLEAIVINRSP